MERYPRQLYKNNKKKIEDKEKEDSLKYQKIKEEIRKREKSINCLTIKKNMKNH